MAYISRLATKTMMDVYDNTIIQLKRNHFTGEEKREYFLFASKALETVRNNSETELNKAKEAGNISAEEFRVNLMNIEKCYNQLSKELLLTHLD